MVSIVVGMQFGSEGKGAITSYLAPIMSLAVRTGASNAGHTIYYNGQRFVMRQIPSAWINPITKLVIGRGAMISKEILLKEINELDKILPIRNRLFIDRDAHVVTAEQIQEEQQSDLAERIGSTSALSGEGIGTATAHKVLRKTSCLQAGDVEEFRPYLTDTVDLVNTELDQDQFVLLEGTQGLGLSLEHGHFPFVTSRDTSATALAASVGVSTHEFPMQVIGVTRSYPIRVAGTSGPFGDDAKEITWEELSRRARSKKPIVERTTITKRVRRISTFSEKEFLAACKINRPTEIALTFADYLDWIVHEQGNITAPIEEFIEHLEALSEVEVLLVKTGPETVIDFDYYRRTMIRKLS